MKMNSKRLEIDFCSVCPWILWVYFKHCSLWLYAVFRLQALCLLGQSIVFVPFLCKRSTCRPPEENEVVKYQWAIHHGGVSKQKEHLLFCGDARVSCQRAPNYQSISGAFRQRVQINTSHFILQSRDFSFQLHTELIKYFPIKLFDVLSCFQGDWSLKRAVLKYIKWEWNGTNPERVLG